MGKDNQPKHRQLDRKLQRRKATRKAYDRLLIVCEGEKTEPLYLGEIQRAYRLSTANVQVLASRVGTDALQIVNDAERLFRYGDHGRGVRPREFERIVVVFDRDDHAGYHAAIDRARALDLRLVNDERRRVAVDLVVSVPCFEVWPLLHFEDVLGPVERHSVISRLRARLPRYEKGADGLWDATRERLPEANRRALALSGRGENPERGYAFTRMHELVERLVHLCD